MTRASSARSSTSCSYVEGRNFWDPTLPGLTPGERAAIYAEMNRVLVALHALDFAAIGLRDFGKPGNYFARQIARWSRQYRASETEPIEAMEQLLVWLPEHIPASDETTLVHGDYRLDNLIFHPSEPRILAVVDWELSTLGHPLADFCLPRDGVAGAGGREPRARRRRRRRARHPERDAVPRVLLPAHRARRGRAGRVGILHGVQPVPHRLHPPGHPAPRARWHRGQPPCARGRGARPRDRGTGLARRYRRTSRPRRPRVEPGTRGP